VDGNEQVIKEVINSISKTEVGRHSGVFKISATRARRHTRRGEGMGVVEGSLGTAKKIIFCSQNNKFGCILTQFFENMDSH